MAEENSEANGTTLLKKAKHRSPNYPAVGLEKALERTATLYEQGKLHWIPISAARQMWNYKAGTGNQIVAALKAYGLVEVTGEGESRQVRVTEAARKILRDHPDRIEILKDTAVKPELHKELWEKYDGDLPVDSVIRNYLIFERNFNENFVDDFIDQFRATIAYANLDSSDKIGDEIEEESPEGGDMSSAAAKPSMQRDRENKDQRFAPPSQSLKKDPPLLEGETELKFNISQSSKARIVFSGQVTQEAIELLAKMLDIQKLTFPAEADLKKSRPAIWHNKEHDQPVKVIGEMGAGPDGRRYVQIEGSDSGVPEDELEYKAC